MSRVSTLESRRHSRPEVYPSSRKSLSTRGIMQENDSELAKAIGSTPGLVRVRLEEHENYHAGNRNIEPDGERPACDSAVHGKPAGQGEKERREHHWQRDDGKDYVAG